jgi:hypothetical protein
VNGIDAGAANSIRRRLFDVEDLNALADREVQVFLRGADDWDLAIAIGSFSERLRNRILQNVSKRRGRLLLEDAALQSEPAPAELQEVRDRLLARARDLYEAGKVHTYLGSFGAAREEEDAQEEAPPGEEFEREPRAGRDAAVPAYAPGPPRRVWVTVGVAVLILPALIWLGRSVTVRPSAGRGGSVKSKVEDFTTRSAPPGSASPQARIGAGTTHVQESAPGPKEGDVLVFDGTSGEPDIAALSQGDSLDTTSGSRAVVELWGNGGQIQVDPGTAIRLGDPSEPPEGPPTLRLRFGHVWLFVRNPNLQVHSPVARVTGSAGSLLKVRVVLSSATEVTVSRGSARVAPRQGEDLVVLGPGESLRIDPQGSVSSRRVGKPEETGWLGLF